VSVEHGAATIERIEGVEAKETIYSDPRSFIHDVEATPGFQETRSTYFSHHRGDRREVQANFLESDAYKEAVAQFVESGNMFRYDPGRFFRGVPGSQSQEVRAFQHGLQDYFRTSADVRRYARAGIHTEAYQRSIDKMNQHDELGSRLIKMGLAPGKSAAKQLVRLIAIDRGYDAEESLRTGDVQRRRARAEAAAVVYGE